MIVSQVTPYGSSGVTTTYQASATKVYQPAKTTALTAPKSDTVELSDSAQARLLKTQGYSVSMIALKLGVDVSTINQYLGIIAAKSTYVAPKATYTEPEALTQAREQLTQDLNQFTLAQYSWLKLIGML